jgi:Protein of unknown function (DUF1236)
MYRTILATSFAALLATSGATLAQAPNPSPGAPAAADKGAIAPGKGSDEQAPSGAAGKPENQDKKGAVETPKKGGPTTGQAKEMKKSGETIQPSSPEKKEAEKSRDGTQPATASTKDAPKSGDKTEAKGGKEAAAPAKDAAEKGAAPSQGTAETKQGSVTLNQQQKTQVHTAFAKHKGSATANLNITVNVGVAVPRSVQLVVIPDDIVVIVPQYRHYRYFIFDNRVYIVDPNTYVVVEVIELA